MIGRITFYGTLVCAVVGILVLASDFKVATGHTNTVATVVSSSDSPRELTTNTWGIFDPRTGTLISGDNTHIVRPIASVTKLFTAYVAVKSAKAHASTTITWSDVDTEGAAGKLFYGEQTTPADLLFPLLIESSNDAAEAIHRVVGSDFEHILLRLKEQRSLPNTHLDDASGLSDRNVSDVDELARFYSFLRRTEPHIIDITQLNVYINRNTGLINNDPARGLTDFTGGKHGYTDAAGRTFVGTFTLSGTNREVGIVLLGSKNLLHDIEKIIVFADARL